MKALWSFTHFSAMLLLVCGCSSFRTDMGRPLPTHPDSFSEGKTRVETVVHNLGPPNRASRLPDGFVFLYEYSRVKEFQLGLSVPVGFLRYFKFVHAWNSLEQHATMLVFNDDGVLRSVGDKRWNENLGGGNAMQFIVMVMSLSDVANLLLPADAHNWGAALLDSPPVGLNRNQSLRYGEHGVQQRLSPEYVGQHTLEMEKANTEREKKRIKRDYQSPYGGEKELQ